MGWLSWIDAVSFMQGLDGAKGEKGDSGEKGDHGDTGPAVSFNFSLYLISVRCQKPALQHLSQCLVSLFFQGLPGAPGLIGLPGTKGEKVITGVGKVTCCNPKE